MATVNVHAMSPGDQSKILDLLVPQSELFRTVVLDVIARISVRIHHDGLAGDGTPIGEYSDGYMQVRTGSFASSPKFVKGANKGKVKNAGKTAKGVKRTQYNRDSSTRVILSLTRQLENDYAVKPGDKGWGVGWNNEHNFDKATWNNTRYGHTIYALTSDELEAVETLTAELITKAASS